MCRHWACVVYELFAKGTLFECFVPNADEVFNENISLLGRPPWRWWDIWEAKDDFFDENGEWDIKSNRVSDGEYRSLKTRMGHFAEDREGSITHEELGDLIELLEQMLRRFDGSLTIGRPRRSLQMDGGCKGGRGIGILQATFANHRLYYGISGTSLNFSPH